MKLTKKIKELEVRRMKLIRFRFTFYRWLINWVELLEIVISILTFTIYRPWWSMSLIAKFSKWWCEKRMIDRKLEYRYVK